MLYSNHYARLGVKNLALGIIGLIFYALLLFGGKSFGVLKTSVSVLAEPVPKPSVCVEVHFMCLVVSGEGLESGNSSACGTGMSCAVGAMC